MKSEKKTLRKSENIEEIGNDLKAVKNLDGAVGRLFAIDDKVSFAITNIHGTILYANDNYCKLSKYSYEDLINSNYSIVSSGNHQDFFFKEMYDVLIKGNSWQGEMNNRAKDGSIFWTSTTIVPVRDNDGKVAQYFAISSDITARKTAETAAEIRTKYLEQAIKLISDAFILYDAEGKLVFYNQKHLEFFPHLTDLYRSGATREDVWRHHAMKISEADPTVDVDGYVEKRRKADGQPRLDCERQLFDGRWVAVRERPMSDGGLVSIRTDITERKRSESAITKLAETDTLTGLPNRALFGKRLQSAMIEADQTGSIVGLLLLDLDNFKLINDTLGHPVGDALLCEVADRLRKNARKIDTVARLGGDEFVVIVSGVDYEEEICTFADRLRAMLANPYYLSGQEVYSSASIGMALYTSEDTNSDELLRNADIALYKAKEAGRSRVKLFDYEMHEEVSIRRTIEQELREAIRNHRLEIYYQPQIDVLTGHIVGAEALLRWSRQDRGTIPPGEFIPVAEATGLIVPLGKWVLNEACQQAREWQNEGIAPLVMAVNLSPVQCKHQDLIKYVRQALEQSRLDPQCLELEITEGVAMSSAAFQIFENLKHLGIKMAIDGFGTGYSSLSQMVDFPVSRLKIERSFIGSKKHSAVCSAIINLGKSLNLSVTAVGVETIQELEALSALGCNTMQGHIFAPAMPANCFADFVRAHNPKKYANKERRSSVETSGMN